MTLVRSLDSVAATTDLETARVYILSMAVASSPTDAGARAIWITPREAAAYTDGGVEDHLRRVRGRRLEAQSSWQAHYSSET
jgi:hypothetical protein